MDVNKLATTISPNHLPSHGTSGCRRSHVTVHKTKQSHLATSLPAHLPKSYTTIMPWIETILEQFETVDRFTTDESEYYGPYNTLLTDLFPHTEHYQVTPQYKGPITPGSIDFTTIYIVRRRKCPVFFIQIKPFPHLDEISTRSEADQQMRERFESIIGRNLIVPKLYGISAMGTCFSVYVYEKETNALSPPSIPRDPTFVTDIAPASRWNFELLEDEGEKKLRELVSEVKLMCQNITGCTPFVVVFSALSFTSISSTSYIQKKR